MAAPKALATAWFSGRITSLTPGSLSGIRWLPPPDCDQGHDVPAGLHPIRHHLELLVHPPQGRIDRSAVKILDARGVAELDEPPGLDADVGQGQRVTALHERIRDHAVADRVGTDHGVAAAATHDRATAEADRDEVWHPEVRSHTANLDGRRRLARKPVDEDAGVGRGTADVDHDRVAQSCQGTGAPHRVGRAGADSEDREPDRLVRGHQCSVVLGEVGVHVHEPALLERELEALDDALCDSEQRSVQSGGVLALQ